MKAVLIGFIIVLIMIVVTYQQEWVTLFKNGDWDTLRLMMGDEWRSVLMITMGFMLLQNVISLIPFLLLTMFNIWFFGFLYGYMWSLAGNILGSVLVFYLARYGLHKWAQKYNHLSIKQKIEKRGFMSVFVSRIIPFIPSSVINIVSGMSNIKAKHYLLATLFGHMIFVFILSLFSIGVISIEHQYAIYLLLTALIVGIIAMSLKKRRMANESL
ncbi:TVP38/TMEM64 family protein [Caldalkalibacillus salinus]|uniref:TVP38/TMEM64 family protein n=1 Tax=Caldalkalibacillus salinus TaxID=2803787 RepID=UPI001F275988|nr:VTT domain-containing protein [Caldalkalibacillus salinus]